MVYTSLYVWKDIKMTSSPEVDNGVYIIDSNDYVNYHPLDSAEVLASLEDDEGLQQRVVATAHEMATRTDEESKQLVATVTKIQTERWRRIQERVAQQEESQQSEASRHPWRQRMIGKASVLSWFG